jgi:hypothetical protein
VTVAWPRRRTSSSACDPGKGIAELTFGFEPFFTTRLDRLGMGLSQPHHRQPTAVTCSSNVRPERDLSGRLRTDRPRPASETAIVDRRTRSSRARSPPTSRLTRPRRSSS